MVARYTPGDGFISRIGQTLRAVCYLIVERHSHDVGETSSN